MLFQGNVAPGIEVIVECSAPPSNAPRPVLVTVAEVPEPGKPFVRPKHALIAAGGAVVLKSGKLKGVGLRVDIDVPEPGTTTVRVTQGTVECVAPTVVAKDERWLFSIA